MRGVGADDDQDCPGHEWVLRQAHLTLQHAGLAYDCAVCGGMRYDDVSQDARRPRLA